MCGGIGVSELGGVVFGLDLHLVLDVVHVLLELVDLHSVCDALLDE